MKKKNYPGWFERLWSQLQEARKVGPMRSLGGKSEAYDQCKLMEVAESDVDYLVKQYIKQRDGIINAQMTGDRPAPFKDICRWIKYERFDDAPCESGTQQTIAKSDQRKSAALARYQSKHLGNGVEPSGGSETGVGGTGQLDLGILESKS